MPKNKMTPEIPPEKTFDLKVIQKDKSLSKLRPSIMDSKLSNASLYNRNQSDRPHLPRKGNY